MFTTLIFFFPRLTDEANVRPAFYRPFSVEAADTFPSSVESADAYSGSVEAADSYRHVNDEQTQ